MSIGNKRLRECVRKAMNSSDIKKNRGGVWLLDCYNNTILKDIACTITTRFNASCDKFLLEVYEDQEI